MVRLRSQRRDCRSRSCNALTLAFDDTFYHFRNDPARISHPTFLMMSETAGSTGRAAASRAAAQAG